MKERLNYAEIAPEGYKSVLNLEMYIRKNVDAALLHLVKLRASQINGCSFCVDMHSKEATKDGEKIQRLHLLAAWRESPLFTDKERAALAWTEELTLISQTGARDEVYQELTKHFSDEEIVNLTFAIGTINIWNRVAVSFRSQHPIDE